MTLFLLGNHFPSRDVLWTSVTLNWLTSLFPGRQGTNSGARLSAAVMRVPLTSLRGPSPHTSAVAWQGPRHHLKGTTAEKINLAASLPGGGRGGGQLQREEERYRKRGGEGLHESRAGIPIVANCFVGRLPKTVL